MGSHVYCAICGGPFQGPLLAEKPRTAAFWKRWAKDIEMHRSGNKSAHGEECVVDEDEDEDESDREIRFEEDHSYDPGIVRQEDVQWIETLQVLGLNPDSERETQVFVSGDGYHDEFGVTVVDAGDDPNVRDFEFDGVHCYSNEGPSRDALFPFHWCCYEMLSKCITGSLEASSYDDEGDLVFSLDNDLLYSIMQELLQDFVGRSFTDIDYGDADRMQGQFWDPQPGYEFLVCDPLYVPGANEIISSMFASDAFKARSLYKDLGSRVRLDPFRRIPYDIVFRISGFISNEDLINLARASWPVHALLQNNDQFWQQRIRTSCFPWFFEFEEFLEQDQTLLRTNNPQRVFQWAEKSTRPERWLTGPLMNLANRRRIWSACEQFGDLYRLREQVKNDDPISDEEILIRAYSKCEPLYVVSSPKATKVNPARRVFWAKTWLEVRSQEKTLESFWDRRGSLIGISLTPDGQERRLLGISDSDDGVIRMSMVLGAEEWIKGLIIHLPVPTHLDDDRLETSPKGLTIIVDSERTSVMGDTSGCHMQRLLSAAPGWCITGVNGNTGFVTDNLQLTRIGLIQAQPPDLADDSVSPYDIPEPLRTELGGLLWDNDYSHILGQSIQEHQTLQLLDGRGWQPKSAYLPDDLISHGALIWAKDVGEYSALRRLAGCIMSGGSPVRPCLSGISAEHEPTTDLAGRAVGVNRKSDLLEPFDIDGPGGEVVTEIEIPAEKYPRALKIHTSLGRTGSWGEAGVEAWSDKKVEDWASIKAPTGETLVGLVVAFGGLDCRRNDADEALGNKVMFVIGGLSMPLGA